MLPWVCAFQGSPPKTWPGLSPGLLSHASQTQRLLAVSTGVPESRSASDPPLLFVMPKHPAWRSSPHRLRAPARSQTFGRRAHRDMGSPCIVPHITAGQPMLLREPSPPYRSRRERSLAAAPITEWNDLRFWHYSRLGILRLPGLRFPPGNHLPWSII
jgi:hypothetical protein